ncbi:hypothetical protein [Streptomyces sp. NPDC057718]|uniref:hypothetical protein n=1 Tax=Streptomyces sp. NPDC057718 TaxID=3346225 RepID=UPI0036AE5A76
MRRQTSGSTGRRGTIIAASAAALCLGAGLLSGCGSGPGDGYTAVGAASGSSKNPSEGDRAPSGEVTLIPLDESGGGRGSAGGGDGGSGRGGGGTSPAGGGSSPSSGAAGPGGSGGARTGTAGGQAGGGAPDGAGTKPTTPSGPSTPGSGSGSSPGGGSSTPSRPNDPGPGTGPDAPGASKPPAPPATPAALTLSAPQRAAADKRWCEKVTVKFRNTGGTPARSGTVTFATHIIGALGVDWATITSSQPLPAPIGAGSSRSQTYTVCVESWRVPLGMRVDTQDVSAVWE